MFEVEEAEEVQIDSLDDGYLYAVFCRREAGWICRFLDYATRGEAQKAVERFAPLYDQVLVARVRRPS